MSMKITFLFFFFFRRSLLCVVRRSLFVGANCNIQKCNFGSLKSQLCTFAHLFRANKLAQSATFSRAEYSQRDSTNSRERSLQESVVRFNLASRVTQRKQNICAQCWRGERCFVCVARRRRVSQLDASTVTCLFASCSQTRSALARFEAIYAKTARDKRSQVAFAPRLAAI